MRTAQLISKIAWGIDPSEVEKKHRSLAKAVNFGILYGKTAHGLAKEWGVAVSVAEAVVDAIMGTFKRLAEWCAEQLSAVRKTGETWTWWAGQKARRRPLYKVADADEYARSNAENSAVNTPVQGTASDFCIASLAAGVEWIEREQIEDRTKLVLPVHDALIFDTAIDYIQETITAARRIMLSHDSNGVPLEVDVKVGPRWGSLEEWSQNDNGIWEPEAKKAA